MKSIRFCLYTWLGFRSDMSGIKLAGSYKEMFTRVLIAKATVAGVHTNISVI